MVSRTHIQTEITSFPLQKPLQVTFLSYANYEKHNEHTHESVQKYINSKITEGLLFCLVKNLCQHRN